MPRIILGQITVESSIPCHCWGFELRLNINYQRLPVNVEFKVSFLG